MTGQQGAELRRERVRTMRKEWAGGVYRQARVTKEGQQSQSKRGSAWGRGSGRQTSSRLPRMEIARALRGRAHRCLALIARCMRERGDRRDLKGSQPLRPASRMVSWTPLAPAQSGLGTPLELVWRWCRSNICLHSAAGRVSAECSADEGLLTTTVRLYGGGWKRPCKTDL